MSRTIIDFGTFSCRAPNATRQIVGTDTRDVRVLFRFDGVTKTATDITPEGGALVTRAIEASRSNVPRSGLPCGSWVSSRGWTISVRATRTATGAAIMLEPVAPDGVVFRKITLDGDELAALESALAWQEAAAFDAWRSA